MTRYLVRLGHYHHVTPCHAMSPKHGNCANYVVIGQKKIPRPNEAQDMPSQRSWPILMVLGQRVPRPPVPSGSGDCGFHPDTADSDKRLLFVCTVPLQYSFVISAINYLRFRARAYETKNEHHSQHYKHERAWCRVQHTVTATFWGVGTGIQLVSFFEIIRSNGMLTGECRALCNKKLLPAAATAISLPSNALSMCAHMHRIV